MMEPYTREYYRAINEEEAPQAKAVADKITEIYSPKSVVDIGCGTGLYLKEFTCPIKVGIDISQSALDEAVTDGLSLMDITNSVVVPTMFDVAICFEVLEHIPQEDANKAVLNICMFSRIIILSAAAPNQPGLNHVNCQTQQYWEEKFGACGYHRNYLNEFWIAHSAWTVPHTLWMVRNLMVFEA
jgi:SAM-dependent methyltransferase